MNKNLKEEIQVSIFVMVSISILAITAWFRLGALYNI